MVHNIVDTLIYRTLDLQNDLVALVSLLKDVEQADPTGNRMTEDTLRDQFTWSGQDLALNNWVVVLPDSVSLVGYGMIQKVPADPNADLSIAVHPSWRRQGIGTQLFVHLLERAMELEARALRAYVPVRSEGGSLFIRKQGFVPISTFTCLNLDLTGMQLFPTPTLPRGFTTRSYEQLKRVDLYTEALNRCYEGYWGHLQCTQEEIAQFLLHLDHAGIFLLFAPDGTIAGTCRAELSKPLTQERGVPTALIDAPGIVTWYREANLALPFLLTVIHWLLPQHPALLELEAWGEAPDTLALYRSLGFTTAQEEISYRRDLE